MTMPSTLRLVVVLSLVQQLVTAANTSCPCLFTVSPDNEPDCRVYGQLGDNVLIPYYRATEECLDAYSIERVSINREILNEMCPNPSSIEADVTKIAVELRFGGSPASLAVKTSYYPRFFKENGDLQDTVDGQSCANPTTCWNIFQTFLFNNPDQVAAICEQFHTLNANDLEVEQTLVRGRLCQETTPDSTCEPLASQIKDLMESNPDKFCSAYSLGPGANALPDCTEGPSTAAPVAAPTNTEPVVTSKIIEGDDCPCLFTVPETQEPGCRVYGQLGDGVLIPYYRASQECLDAYQIAKTSINRDGLFTMCPFPNATDANVQLIVNEIRNGGTPTAAAVKNAYPQYFDEDGNLREDILDTRNSPCTTPTLCWDIVRTFFVNNPDEIAGICEQFHEVNANDLETEQSLVRNRICQEETPDDACEPLAGQIKGLMMDNPDKVCSSYSLGPKQSVVPGPSCPVYSFSMDTSGSMLPSVLTVFVLVGMVIVLRD